MTSQVVRSSCAVYGVLLTVYPPDVRERFGNEMADTFAWQLADAWEENGWAGVLGIWSLALPELFLIALPRQLARPVLVLPFVSIVTTAAIFFSLIWALGNSLALNAWYHNIAGGGRH